MNILLVIADLGLGGAQQVVINLANELVRQGHTIYLYDVYPELRKQGMVNKLKDPVNLVSKDYNEEPCQILEKTLNSFLYRSGIDKTYLKRKRQNQHQNNLNKILEVVRFDAVNSHVYWADEFVLENLKFLHNKWWVTLHASYSTVLNKKNGRTYFIEKINEILHRSIGIIYLSEDELRKIKNHINVDNIDFIKIFNGLPFVPKEGNLVKSDKFTMLCASRAIKEKGWNELIEAVISLKDDLPICLNFAGDGPLLNELQTRYSSAQGVKFLGYQSDMVDVILDADVLVLPSYSEALPTILLEGIFHHKPLIATEVGEVNSIINNEKGVCGILIPASKGTELINHLKTAILKMNMEINIFKSNKAAFELAKRNFSVERMANDYINLFMRNK